MRNPKNKSESLNGGLNTIGVGTSVIGNINSNGDLRIDGEITGDLTSSSRIVIGSKANIKGNLKAANAIVEGKVTGNVEVKEVLSLKATALIEGDISMQKLVVENGAVFNGKSVMHSGKVPVERNHEAEK